MNLLLIAMYLAITTATAILFVVIFKYLKEKPYGRQGPMLKNINCPH